MTWDLFAVKPEQLLEMLPKEFNRFKPMTAEAGTDSSELARSA